MIGMSQDEVRFLVRDVAQVIAARVDHKNGRLDSTAVKAIADTAVRLVTLCNMLESEDGD